MGIRRHGTAIPPEKTPLEPLPVSGGAAVIAFCRGFVFGMSLAGGPDSLRPGLAAGGAAGLIVFLACMKAPRQGLWEGLGY